jgi:hypothetical protein
VTWSSSKPGSSTRSEQSISGVAKSWENVTVRIQLAIERSGDHGHIRMFTMKSTKSFRRCHEAEESNACRTGAL